MFVIDGSVAGLHILGRQEIYRFVSTFEKKSNVNISVVIENCAM